MLRAQILLTMLLSFGASAQGIGSYTTPGISPSNSYTAQKWTSTAATGAQAFGMNQGARFFLDGDTGAKYFSSDGTNLVITGLNLSAPGYGLNGQPPVNQGMDATGSDTRIRMPSTGTMYFSNNVVNMIVANGTNVTTNVPLKVGTSGTEFSASIRRTSTLDFDSAVNGTCSPDLTIAVTSASIGAEVSIRTPNQAVVAGSMFHAWVSSSGVVSIRHCCVGAVSCDPASGTFSARVWNP